MARDRRSLQQVSFTPLEFAAAEFTPSTTIAPGTLANAMARGEERRRQATDRIGVFENAVNQARELLHNDEDTMNWYRDYAQKYKDAIDAAVQIGDYEGAMTTASRAATDFLDSKEFTTRSRYNKEYDDWEKALDNMHLPSDYSKFWKATHQYSDKDLIDSNGDIIEGKKWDAPLPNGPLDWDAEFIKAAGYVAESVQGSESTRTNTGDYTSSTRGSSRTTRAKPVDKIYENAKARFSSPQMQAMLDENYDYLIWKYDDLISKRDKYEPGSSDYERLDYQASRLLSEEGSVNGAIPTRQEWENHHINKSYATIKNAAYTNVQTGSVSSDERKNPRLNPNDPNYWKNQEEDPTNNPDETPTTPGAPVENRVEKNNHYIYDNITNSFGGAKTSDVKQTVGH